VEILHDERNDTFLDLKRLRQRILSKWTFLSGFDVDESLKRAAPTYIVEVHCSAMHVHAEVLANFVLQREYGARWRRRPRSEQPDMNNAHAVFPFPPSSMHTKWLIHAQHRAQLGQCIGNTLLKLGLGTTPPAKQMLEICPSRGEQIPRMNFSRIPCIWSVKTMRIFI